MTNHIKIIIYALSLFNVLLRLSAYTEPLIKPLDTKNTHVLYISHLFIPVEGSSAIKTGSGDFSINLIQSSTNFDIYQYSEHGKQGNIDLETTSVYSGFLKKFGDSNELKVVLPFYYHSGGFMDHTIESFHKAFPGNGLRNGGREYARDNEIHIQYRIAEGGPNINKSFYGIGDPSLFYKRILSAENPGIACTLGIKPGIGNKAFINSNTADYGISVTADYKTGIFYLYAMAGYSYFYGDGIYKKELEQYRDYMISSSIGAGAALTESFYFTIQFYCNTSIYDTGIGKIDYPTVINSYAVRWRMNDQSVFQFCIDEDSFTYATADIAFSLRTEHSF